MEQVKIFFSCRGSGALDLEKSINKWLAEMGDTIEITQRLIGQSGRLDVKVTVTIFYKTKK